MVLRITTWNGKSWCQLLKLLILIHIAVNGIRYIERVPITKLSVSTSELICAGVYRNPFGYQPWRDKRSFEVRYCNRCKVRTGKGIADAKKAMFDILEADIVVMQETKIQRKDLRDDMVLVPGWDCYFSLPKYKKGGSMVS